MTVKFGNRVKHTLSGIAAQGDLTFATAVAGFQTLDAAGYVAGDVCHYTIEVGEQFEIGTGTITVTSGVFGMSRVVIESSAAGNAKLSVPASGTCFVTVLAQDIVQNLPNLLDVATTVPNANQVLAYDSGTAKWTPTNPAGGIVSVADTAALNALTGMAEKDLIWVLSTKSLYIYDGAEWDRVSTGSQVSPRFTTSPPDSFVLSQTGAASNLTAVAVDDAGFPITYDWDAFDSAGNVYKDGTLPNMLTNVGESSGVFALTPSTNASHAGDLTFRSKASDGVVTLVGLTTLKLIFTNYVAVPALTRNYANRTVQLASSTGFVSVNSNRSVTTYGGPYQGPLKDGKFYTEISFLTGQYYSSASYNAFVIGCYDRAVVNTSPDSFGGNTTANCWSGFFPEYTYIGLSRGNTQGARAFVNNPTTSGGAKMNRDGADRIMVAWDTPNKKVWWGMNGNWSDSGTQGTDSTGDPVSGSGIHLPDLGLTSPATVAGQAHTATSSFCFYWCCRIGSFNLRMQIYAGEANNLAYSVPTGFNRQ